MTESLSWRIELSSTYRGIYVIRYLLFAGGVAIAVALAERLLIGPKQPGIALLLGLCAGLWLFRHQLRPLRFPRIALSRDNLYLLRRGQTVTIPWNTMGAVKTEGDSVEVELKQAVPGLAEPRLHLKARELGSPPDVLASRLSKLHRDELYRARLPDERRARAMLGLEGT